jgi:hypothetical protein
MADKHISITNNGKMQIVVVVGSVAHFSRKHTKPIGQQPTLMLAKSHHSHPALLPPHHITHTLPYSHPITSLTPCPTPTPRPI